MAESKLAVLRTGSPQPLLLLNRSAAVHSSPRADLRW